MLQQRLSLLLSEVCAPKALVLPHWGGEPSPTPHPKDRDPSHAGVQLGLGQVASLCRLSFSSLGFPGASWLPEVSALPSQHLAPWPCSQELVTV